MKKIIIVTLLSLFSFNAFAEPDFCKVKLSPASYQDCFAFTAIIRGKAVPSSYKDVYEIPEEWRNIRTLPWELGLIVLDRSKSKEALKSLAYLNSFQLDGALSEDHTCVSLNKGKKLLPYLNEVINKSKDLCATIIKSINIEENKNMCRTQPLTVKRTKSLIKLINKGVLCEK